MKKTLVIIPVIVTVLFWGLSVAMAAGAARVITKGTLGVLQNGQETMQITSEMPIPPGELVCHGECVVQARDFQLAAQDKTLFSVTQSDNQMLVGIKSGQISFALRDCTGIAFQTPDGNYRCTKVVPDASGSPARGIVTVTPSGTVFAGEAGEINFAAEQGTIVLTAGSVVGSGTSATAATAAGATGAATTATGAAGLGLTTLAPLGAAAAGAAAGVAAAESNAGGSWDRAQSNQTYSTK